MNQTIEVRKDNPPYLSLSKFQKVIEIVSTRSLTVITSQEFMDRDFSGTEALLAISSLRFLGIINPDGSKTDSLDKLQLKGEGRKKALEEIVKKAYSKLFEVNINANNLSREELFNEFKAVYKISPRLVTSSLPVFLWLCAESGLSVQNIPSTRERTHITNRQQKDNEKKRLNTLLPLVSNPTHSPADQVIELGRIRLVLPNDDKFKRAYVQGKFSEVYEKLDQLSKEIDIVIPEESPDGKGSQAAD